MKKFILFSLYAALLSGTILGSDAPEGIKLSDEVTSFLTQSTTLWTGSDRWKKLIQKEGAIAHTKLEREHTRWNTSFYRSVERIAQFKLENKKSVVTVHSAFDQQLLEEHVREHDSAPQLFTSRSDKPKTITDFNDHTKCTYTLVPLYIKKDDGKCAYVGVKMRGECVTTMQSELLSAALAKALDRVNNMQY